MAFARFHTASPVGVTADYDRKSDVLYVTLGKSRPAESESHPRGILLRFGFDDGLPCGVTVIGYKHNEWSRNIVALSKLMADHLSVSPRKISAAIKSAIEE
jgi:hypothetical protein